MARLTIALLAAVAVVPFAQADYCCTALSPTSLRSRLLFPDQDAYEIREASYFDVKQQVITPNCMVQPKSAKEVSLAVKTLTAASLLKQCKFAIRSGGHTPYAGASNIEGGVTLDLKYLSTVEYSAKTKSVQVGPAARWNDVFEVLERLGVMTTGGRSSTVVVGGLTLGGGISYFSPERGLVCDNVLDVQDLSPDLFTVIKGGNNNFGIVTSLIFDTFDYNGMWGGLVIYPESTIQDHFKALINFSNNIGKYPKGSAIVMLVYQSSAGADLILNAYDYAEPTPRPAAYDEFLAIPGNISDTTRIRNMSSLAAELAGSTTSSVYLALLLSPTICEAHEIYMNPIPPSYWRQSAAKGGNVLGFERFGEQVLCLYQPYISWQGAEQDALFQSAGADLINRIRDYAESIGADNPYLYLNYPDVTQDPLASYDAANVKKMKTAAKKYDPFGVWQNLVPGGSKISQA